MILLLSHNVSMYYTAADTQKNTDRHTHKHDESITFPCNINYEPFLFGNRTRDDRVTFPYHKKRRIRRTYPGCSRAAAKTMVLKPGTNSSHVYNLKE